MLIGEDAQADQLGPGDGAQDAEEDHPDQALDDGQRDLGDGEDGQELADRGAEAGLGVGQRQLARGDDVRRQVRQRHREEHLDLQWCPQLLQGHVRGVADPWPDDRHREDVGAQRGDPAVGEQQGLEEQHHRAQEGHHRWPEEDRAGPGAGRVRRRAGDRRHLQGRQDEGEGAGGGEQDPVLRVLTDLTYGGADALDDERGGGDRPADAV
ncbi:hypothetical protein SDC9_164233 [bioreactor metagenome]|uniref:Uncharacterized protein n=1 Tax=bioreactor metagenome TaxID=1076179 RepID=A0A645FT34_9ZZZZ